MISSSFLKKIGTLTLFLFLLISIQEVASGSEKPNIIVILTDDQGWADTGFNGSTDIRTPHLDDLASNGIRMTSGYVTHSYCSPSRAGLITGRYQYRFGHENNIPFDPENPELGTPLSETFLSTALKNHGYTTAAIGKWHLGDHKRFWPTNRGFDHWFGFTGGGMNYWGKPKQANRPIAGILRNGEPVPADQISYLTDDFTNEAVQFVKRNKDRPFFLYLAYNAPHGPNHVTRKYLKQTRHIEYSDRSVYAAMIAAIDRGVGKLQSTLTNLGLSKNTLIFFLSDNGGRFPMANNKPFRGHKGMLFEGGIRVPFTITWPKKLDGGNVYHKPVSALDIFPTAMAAAGASPSDYSQVDGVNLLPYLKNKKNGAPHDALFWRYSGGKGYAVRKGKYKLVRSEYKQKKLLFNLKKDPHEHHNIADTHPGKVNDLQRTYDRWEKEMRNPRWTDGHIENVHQKERSWENTRMKATEEQK